MNTTQETSDHPQNYRIRWHNRLSFRMIGMVAIVLGIIALFIFFFFPSRLKAESIRSLIDKAESIASITAYGIRAGLVFDDMESVQKTLEITRQLPDLQYLVVENDRGQTVASINQADAFRYSYREPGLKGQAGKEELFSISKPILHEGSAIGNLYLGLSTRALNEAVANSQTTVALVSCIIFLGGLAAALFISTLITRPLSRMVRTVETIARGDLAHRAPVHAANEIGQLARAFNRMLDQLQAAQQRNEEINRTLEKRIKVRTYELTREINERLKTEDALRQSYEQLKELDTLKTDFISTVSHELRTPMTSVLGFAKICRKKMDGAIWPALENATDNHCRQVFRQIRHDLDIIVLEGERLTSMINDVLDLAKLESGKMEFSQTTFNILDLANKAVEVVSPLIGKKNLRITTHFAEPIPDYTGDADRILQVLINVLSNAVKFTDEGLVSFSVQEKNGEVLLQIEDTGMGIPEKDLQNIFEKFKQVGDTLTGKPKGPGLGLPISRHIVDGHGGRIWAETLPQGGSRFSVSLPFVRNGENGKAGYPGEAAAP